MSGYDGRVACAPSSIVYVEKDAWRRLPQL
jgi:hypothetical protein